MPPPAPDSQLPMTQLQQPDNILVVYMNVACQVLGVEVPAKQKERPSAMSLFYSTYAAWHVHTSACVYNVSDMLLDKLFSSLNAHSVHHIPNTHTSLLIAQSSLAMA